MTVLLKLVFFLHLHQGTKTWINLPSLAIDERVSVTPEHQLRLSIWERLQEAVTSRESAWRTPVLASVDSHGMPQARTVVLREVDPVAQRLVIYTDHRSPKAVAFADRPEAVLVFWSKALGWQLRVAVDVRVETRGRW